MISQIDLDKALVEKRLMLFAPKTTRDLRAQYPKLGEYSQFRSSKLGTGDMLFVWWMRCASSPYYDEPDEAKLDACIDMAYPTPQQRESKRKEFEHMRFPDEIKAAMQKMSEFNLSVEVRRYINARTTIRNCESILAVDVTKMDPEEQGEWAKRAKDAWNLLDLTTKSLESSGVAEEEETIIDTQGAVKHFRETRK